MVKGEGGGSRRSSRRGPQRSKPPPRSSTTSSQSKAPTSRNRHRPSRRIRSVIKVQSPATTLPADLWTRLLPFLTWRDTTAMLTVCSEWRNVLKSAKKLHPEWKSTVLGPSSNGFESLELLRTNHLNWADTRFPPDLVLLSAASKDPSPWHTGGYWEEAIAAIEEAKLLPLKCRIVGFFTMNEVLRKNEQDAEEERGSSAVTLSISVAHLPETTVEIAEFDRKDLRRCQRGVELENPFTELEKNESPSFLLFGVNDQSASQLVPVVEEWYPQAPVIGGVSPLIDRCVPLVTYFGAPFPQKRKNRASKRCSRPRSQVSFPSTMLLRFHGNIGIKSFSSSGYYPVTPVLRCERTSEFKLAQMSTCDLVSLSHDDSEEPQLYPIMDLVEPAERFAIEQEGRMINIFSCSESAPLDLLLSKSDVIPTTQVDLLEFVFWSSHGVMLLPCFSWPEGAYGVLVSHQPTRTAQSLTEAVQSIKEALSSVNERAFGAFVVAGALDDVENSAHAKDVSQLCTEAFSTNLGGCLVSSSVGPVAFPGGFQALKTTQVQTHTTCGAIFFTKA
ncbi:hypothetical protein P3T76_012309 [Phytophthora citrophthora]|uniref:F-box domain-containing protein n=1 Tax=Phytophthora citrophthora TaxID=4793 RepID=A0AAD9LDD6_9STRA|nr:hypothetical protein P3T76_012309 [Phytophthora citrophthora]